MALDLLACMKGFAAIAKYRGFSQAARHLHVSTSVLTNQLKALETQLGEKLINRTTRRVELTEAGVVYLEWVKNILSDIQEAKNSVHNLEKEPHGRIVLGVPGFFHSLFFIKYLQDFLKKYPKIQLLVIDENYPTDLLSGLADVIISEIDIDDKQLIKESLLTVKRSIYAAPSYVKQYGIPKKIADLKRHNCLIAKRVSPNEEWVLNRNKKVQVQGNYASSSGSNIFYAALAGLGLIWSTDILLKEEIRSKKLIEINLEDSNPSLIKIYLYYRPVSHRSNIKLLVDKLKSVLSDV